MDNKQEKRNAKGGGSVRQRADGRWEARCTINGKRRSFYANTQKEVLKLLRAAQNDCDEGQYLEPSKMTVEQWFTIWMEEYCKPRIRPSTYAVRYGNITTHIIPALGQIKLQNLNPTQIQSFINNLYYQKHLAASTIGTIFITFKTGLKQAVLLKYIRENPAEVCTVPKKAQKDIVPLSEADTANFLAAIKGHRFEELYSLALFTGMRFGEILGLPWDAVDFKCNTITVKQQLYHSRYKKIEIPLIGPTKNGKTRVLTAPPFVMTLLKNIRNKQFAAQIRAGAAWNNEHNLVFTNELGKNWSQACVWEHFRALADQIHRPDLRFHDLRHNYAVTALQEGDNPKTVQEALGHATAQFTLDVYTHLSEKMKQESANRMQAYYEKFNA